MAKETVEIKKVKIIMLANYDIYEFGKEYEVEIDVALTLVGVGHARLVENK